MFGGQNAGILDVWIFMGITGPNILNHESLGKLKRRIYQNDDNALFLFSRSLRHEHPSGKRAKSRTGKQKEGALWGSPACEPQIIKKPQAFLVWMHVLLLAV